ncbi:unnamed protein product [Protopolystoma xenopodis]|uniref:Uncharacterized protein n=1 Tax=Protopolystoma xenopodis TaxID=117903 RepID=A0A3S5BFF3_9PLAT|nr:unnamed protein product [Protopolystoma xenopodis]
MCYTYFLVSRSNYSRACSGTTAPTVNLHADTDKYPLRDTGTPDWPTPAGHLVQTCTLLKSYTCTIKIGDPSRAKRKPAARLVSQDLAKARYSPTCVLPVGSTAIRVVNRRDRLWTPSHSLRARLSSCNPAGKHTHTCAQAARLVALVAGSIPRGPVMHPSFRLAASASSRLEETSVLKAEAAETHAWCFVCACLVQPASRPASPTNGQNVQAQSAALISALASACLSVYLPACLPARAAVCRRVCAGSTAGQTGGSFDRQDTAYWPTGCTHTQKHTQTQTQAQTHTCLHTHARLARKAHNLTLGTTTGSECEQCSGRPAPSCVHFRGCAGKLNFRHRPPLFLPKSVLVSDLLVPTPQPSAGP